MERTSSVGVQWSGKLVAFEGDTDTISDQLRLLPPSPKILVLPPFIDDPSRVYQNKSFDAHAFIHNAHDAYMERIKAARSFLRNSTTAQPRLVCMNGGYLHARKICISKISENITNGDIGEAETLFNDITQLGVARLLTAEPDISKTDPELDIGLEEESREVPEDPTIRAVKAAELLYCETATLQAEDMGLQEDLFDNLNSRSRGSYMGTRRSMKSTPEVRLEHLAAYDVVDAKDQGLLSNRGEDAVQSMLALPSQSSVSEGRSFPLRRSLTARSSYTTVPMYQVEENRAGDYDKNHPAYWDESHMSMPPTPVVVYGQAFLVDVQTTSPGKQPRRIRSVDRFFPSKSRCRETFYGTRRASSITLGGIGLQTLPRKSFLKASETTIKKLPTSTKSKKSTISAEESRQVDSRCFVDRGTDNVDIPIVDQESASEEFVSVFPLMEDLIISFNDGQPNGFSDLIIQFYKNDRYSAVPSLFEPNSFSHIPASDPDLDIVNSSTPSLTTEKDDLSYECRASYDPYGSDGSYSVSTERPWPPREKLFRVNSSIQRPNSQTYTLESVAERFIQLSLSTTSSVLDTHNSLRQLLSTHLPTGDNGYSQHCFSVPPEVDRIWKPVFGNDPFPRTGDETANVDQIIALGCESGVPEEFCDQICWNIERLATKNDGDNKSAKLDLRYLIAIVMQASSALCLNVESTFNPLSKPSTLATLLVPQLEAYLATNKNARLLILKYPSEHLPTMIALRKILGNDLFKIAGILDSLESNPPYIAFSPPSPPSHHHTHPANYLPSNTYHATSLNALLTYSKRNASFANTSSTISSSKRPDTPISFAKANYVLPSTAVENEIAAFISEIRKSLVEKSPLYASELHPKPVMAEIGVQVPTIPPIPKTTSRRKASTSPTGTQSILGSTRDYDQDQGSLYPPSSFKSPTIRRERETRKKWDNFYVGEEDSDDDEFDKMIMGRKHAKILPEVRMAGPMPPKKNMQKALKWLGVA